MTRPTNLAATLVVAMLLANPAWVANGATPSTTQDPASAQPTLPKPMPDLSVPAGQLDAAPKKVGKHRRTAKHVHHGSDKGWAPAIDRPALATVDLTERLPYPPQPPHVTVPVPAYPLENLVSALTTPPPPIVCRPTRRDRFQPDPHLVGDTPVLCTADNP